MRDRGLGAVRRGEAGDDHEDPGRHEGDDRDELDDREPEFDLAEQLDGGEVHEEEDEHDRDGQQHGHPDPLLSDPQLPVAGDGYDVGHADDHPGEPVGPSDEEARPGSEDVRREVLEGAVLEFVQEELAHGSHDEEEHEADDRVDEEDRRAGDADRLPGAEEEARADRPADGDELDVAVAQPSAEVLARPVGRIAAENPGGRRRAASLRLPACHLSSWTVGADRAGACIGRPLLRDAAVAGRTARSTLSHM